MVQLKVKQKEQPQVVKLGGQLSPDGKTLVIPDSIKNINGFMPWLPKKEGYIVQRPYFVLRGKWRCWKCKQPMQAVALGAKCYQELTFTDADKLQWVREEGPIMFTKLSYLDATISKSMQENYPFFKHVHSKKLRKKEWGNCCSNCGTLQEEDDDWRYGFHNPFGMSDIEDPINLRVIYFSLIFDYYIRAECMYSTQFPDIIH